MTDSITCPVCGMTSYNPNDIREGYCGNCNDWTSQEDEGGHNTFRDGKIHVMAEQCANCLFKPKDRLVEANGVQQIVAETKDVPGATFICHLGSISGDEAICHTWFELFSDRDPVLRMAKAMDVIKQQQLPVSETKKGPTA